MLNSWVVTKALQRNDGMRKAFRMLWIGSFLGVTTELQHVVSRALTGRYLMVAIILLVSGCSGWLTGNCEDVSGCLIRHC